MTSRSPGSAALAMLLAALVPGLGHVYAGRVRRGLLYAALVLGAFALGIALDGRLSAPEGAKPLAMLAAGATVATGLPGVAARLAGLGGGNILSPSYEYGCTYLLCAGIMNALLVLDAWDVARGRKP